MSGYNSGHCQKRMINRDCLPMTRTGCNLWFKYWEERSCKVHEYDAETAVLLSEMRLVGAKSVLSLGCGTAPFLRRLASEGFECTGVDHDKVLLDIGEDLAGKENKSIRFVYADVRRLPTIGIFDAVIAMHLTFSESDWVKILKSLTSLIKPAGVFIAGYVYEETKLERGTQGVISDLLVLSSGHALVEVDRFSVESGYYQVSLVLMEETPSGICCDRRCAKIHFLPRKVTVMDLLRLAGYTNLVELREEDIGFPGLKAIVVKSIFKPSSEGG